ncbi:ABC transporter ATP-binding protein [Nocardia sp. NPDC055321]
MIRVEGLDKSFAGGKGVADIDFQIADGEVGYLVGPNGSGKTTLLRIIAGALRQDRGTVLVNGMNLRWSGDAKRQIGVNLDSFAVDRGQTAWTHILWQARAAGLGRTEAREVLELVGLYEVRRNRLKTFSYGMLQRLGLASALLGDPQTIVLDEPLNGLDAEGIIWLRDLIEKLTAQGRCFLVASHIFAEIEATAGRVIVLGGGRVVFDGTVAELCELGEEPRRFESAYTKLTAPYVSYNAKAR